ncbi:MAG: ABC transporter permease subunit [Methylobacter sp.]|nr:ABC transporter permease subunit [Methylobacter sp.]
MNSLSLFLLEGRQLRHDRVFWATALICMAALLFGLSNGRNWLDNQQAQIAAYEMQTSEQVDNLRKAAVTLREQHAPPAQSLAERNGDPRYAFALGSAPEHVCRHSGAIAALSVGQSDLYNACTFVSAWEIGGAYDEQLHRNLENPLRLLFGRFDAAFAIVMLLPIAILIIGYNQLSGERELGTLALLASQPVAVRRIIATRFLVRALVFLLLTLTPLSLALWLWGISPDQQSTFGEWLGWLIATAAYLLFWFACAFWVNTRSKSTAENGLLLAGLWLLFVVVVPGCLNLGLKQFYPLPSRMTFIDASREATIEVGKRKTELLGKYLIDHPDRVPKDQHVNVDDFIQTRMALDEESKRVLAPGQAEFDSLQQQQRDFVERLRFLSPAIVYQQVILQLTGQGQDHQQSFLAAVADFHQRLRAFYFPKFIQDGPEFNDYLGIPGFKQPPLALEQGALQVLVACAGLMLPSLGLIAIGWRRMKRISVKVEA